MDPQTVYICLGGNQGNVLQSFYDAKNLLKIELGKLEQQSDVFKTAAWGDNNQPEYLNQVISFKTTLNPEESLQKCLHIEKQLGRERNKENKWAARKIDIDLLLYGDIIYDSTNLKIPHPRMLERNFVMVPLAQIAGKVIHPIVNKTILELSRCTNDSLAVKKIEQI